MKKVNDKEVIKKVKEIIKNNDWLNGMVDFRDGDITAILKSEEYFNNGNTIYETDNEEELFNELKKWDYGIWKFENLIFINDYQFGTFVYDLSDTKNYVEHLTIDEMSFMKFKETLDYLLGKTLECVFCGKLIKRSVNELMNHLTLEHNAEFVDNCEKIFFKKWGEG
jgi:hypothetical protein